MTCIAAIAEAGVVYMAADSAITEDNGFGQYLNAEPKLFAKDGLLIGHAGTGRSRQIVQHVVDFGFLEVESEILPWLVQDFVPAVRAVFRDDGQIEINDGLETCDRLLIGVGGRLFIMENDFTINEPLSGLAAIGCAAQVALGALIATKNTQWSASHRLAEAMVAAEALSGAVRKPFHYLTSHQAPVE